MLSKSKPARQGGCFWSLTKLPYSTSQPYFKVKAWTWIIFVRILWKLIVHEKHLDVKNIRMRNHHWGLYSCKILYRGYVMIYHIVIWTNLFRGTWVMVQLITNDDRIIISSYRHINWPFQRHLANVSSVPSIRHPAGHHVVSCKKRKSQKESERLFLRNLKRHL